MRAYSTEAEPHRALSLYDDPQRGEDVRALQAAAKRRLQARGIVRPLKVDGVFGPQTQAALDTAAWALGVDMKVVKDGVLPESAQLVIRYPGRRSDAQLKLAQDRMERWRKERDAQRRQAGLGPAGDSGLADGDRRRAIDLSLGAFELLFHNAPAVHYTQGPRRWDGIAQDLKAYRRGFPTYADCSSAYSWASWNGLDHFGVSDILNGQGWLAGYTGTLLLHGDEIDRPVPGCAIIYGNAWPGAHVVMYDEDDMVYSHGSEAGPFHIDMHYRGDILSIRQYV